MNEEMNQELPLKAWGQCTKHVEVNEEGLEVLVPDLSRVDQVLI